MQTGSWCGLVLMTGCLMEPAATLDTQMASSVLASEDGGQCGLSYPTYPPLADFWCVAEAQRVASATGCSSDADCELVVFQQNCIGFGGSCERKAVLKTERSAYTQALASRVAAFCASCSCTLSGSCAERMWVARCVASRCEAVPQ